MVRHRVVPGALVAVLLLAASAAMIAARRPDVFVRPQFWAEDGMVWYASAHDGSWITAIFAPYGGYLQLFPRLAALAVQLVDLAQAPLLMNGLALLVQAIAPAFLLSDRFERVVPGRARRLVLSLVLIAVPNMMEIHANVTNSQVHLALLAFLVLIAAPAPEGAWRVFDTVCLLLSGLSGPFCVLLLPVAALCWLHDRSRWSLVRLALVVGVATVQIAILERVGAQHRLGSALPRTYGASVASLLDLLGRQIFVAGLAGLWRYVGLNAGAFADHPWLPILIGAAGLVFLARALLVTRSFALRVFVLFAALHLAGALTTPIVFGDRPLWDLLKMPAAGQRYYFFATLAFLATLLWTVAADPRRAMRGVAAALLAVLVLVGIPGDWRLPPHPDLSFDAQAARFAAAPPGKKVSLHITPEPWTMVLVKH